MKVTAEDYSRLQTEAQRLVEQLKALGAVKIILFGSLARGRISLSSDIDLLVLFEGDRPARDLTRWVYEQIDAREGVDLLAHSTTSFEKVRGWPFYREILKDAKVLYERPAV